MKALIVTASIVLSALLLCIAWLAFFPGDAGAPVISVAVSPPPPKPPAPPPQPPKAAAPPSIDLPPGFGLNPARPQSAPGGAPAGQQQQAGTPAQPGAPAPGQPATVQTVAVPPPVGPPPGLPPPPEEETASITLVEIPVPELVEESQYGPLPKVATDGRRPIDVYARPSKYAVKAADAPPRIAVLINGMGLSDGATAEAIKGLPAPISVAYGAYGRNIQDWVAKARGLLFVDDGSVKDSVGAQIASTIGLDFATADVQIDAVPSPDDINKALARLEAVAKEKGFAIGIASAKPATIKALAQWAGQLQAKNIILIPVSAAIRSQRQS
jgi:polysaccharide deacetylase 2 family uncharacterized protein YibQ